MKKIYNAGIVLTKKEAIAIAECLETLEGMSGAYDEEFTKEAQRAGRFAKKIRYQLIEEDE